MEYKDYYKALGVDRTASQDEIKSAYRKLAYSPPEKEFYQKMAAAMRYNPRLNLPW